MLIIGLFGGKPATRVAIATQLETHPCTRVNVLTLAPAPGLTGALRARLLEQHFGGLDRRKHAAHLVVTHVESVEEAELIRAAGGRLWFVEGVPSDVVPIRAGDLGVSSRPGRERYLDAGEALQQEMLAQARAWKAAWQVRRGHC